MICGAELGEREKYCGSCGAKAPDGAVDKEDVELKYVTKDVKSKFTWDWHKVYCNFLLICQCIRNIFGGLFWIIGGDYIASGKEAFSMAMSWFGITWWKGGEQFNYSDEVFIINSPDDLPAIIRIYFIFGILYIALGIFGLMTRHKLANFRVSAVSYLGIFLIASVALPAIVTFFLSSRIFQDAYVFNVMKSLLPQFIMLIGNMIYYLKRIDVYE